MIKTFVGPMFSGKTSAMISTYNNIWNKENVICFKPEIDTRDDGYIKCRNSNTQIMAHKIKNLNEIYDYLTDNIRTIFIDEIQFLQGDVKVLIDLSVMKDIDVYTAGLNMTAEQKPFGLMPYVLAVSDEVENIYGVCYDCNKPAPYTYCKIEKTSDVLVGDVKEYKPLCARCLLLNRTRKLKR